MPSAASFTSIGEIGLASRKLLSTTDMAPLVPFLIKLLAPIAVKAAVEKLTAKTKEVNMLNPTVAGLLRHILTTAGGVLVAKGTLDEAMLQALVGALVTIAGVAWSIVEKKRR